jgi:hypothetical protein
MVRGVLEVLKSSGVLIRIQISDPFHWITDPDPALLFRRCKDVNKR